MGALYPRASRVKCYGGTFGNQPKGVGSTPATRSIMGKDKSIENGLADIIMERPYGFKVGGRRFFLYPMTLGKSFLLSRLIDGLEINKKLLGSNPYMEALRLCSVDKEKSTRIIVYNTILRKRDLFNDELVDGRIRFFMDTLDAKELAELMSMVLSSDDIGKYTKYLGIDRDRKSLDKVMSVKGENKNNIDFFGKSVMGTLIIPACEKLNMTPSQVVWGISLSFLRLLMADCVTSVYLTDDERKKVHISSDRNFISGDDPRNMELIKSMKWD